MYGMTLEDIEKFFIDAYIRRSKQWNKDYLHYHNIMAGNFDVIETMEQHQKDHDALRNIMENMVERGIFEKRGDTYKLNHYLNK